MNAFSGLFFKELKLMRISFFVGLGMINVVALLSIWLKEYYNQPIIPVILFLFLCFYHFFYLPLLFLYSLHIEGRGQLWLHNPNPTYKLIMAKLAAVFVYFFISLILTFVITRLSFNGVLHLGFFEGYEQEINRNLTSFAFAVMLVSIYFSIWLLFYWTIYHYLKNFPFLAKIRWLVIFILWICITSILSFIKESTVYKYLEKNGELPFGSFELSNDSFVFEVGMNWMTGIIGLIELTIVFLISVWVLERKVEV